MTTYYMRADGTASAKEDATSANSAATAMSMTVHNAETFSAGDTIVLSDAGGDYRGLSGAVMTPPSSGSSSNPIIYKADGSPIVSGAADLTDGATYKWTASGSGTNEYYVELLAGGDPSLSTPTNVFVDKTLATEGTVGSLSDGEWDYGNNDTLGYNTVYYRSDAGDPDGLSLQIEAAQANNGLNLNGDDYIEVHGIAFQGCKNNGITMVGGLTGILIHNCQCMYNSDSGIQIYDVVDAVGTFLTVDGCELAYNEDAGLTMLEENNNVTIRNNHCHHNTFPGVTGNVGGIHVKCDDGKQSDNVVIEGNWCHNNGPSGVAEGSGFGFYIDTLGTGCIVRYNRASNNNTDGFVYEWTDSGKFYYNIADSNNRHGFSIIRRCNSNEIYNNLAYNNGNSGSMWGGNYSFWTAGTDGPTYTVSNNLIKNNIGFGGNDFEVSCTGGWENDGTNGSGNVYDRNIFADPTSGNFHNWGGTGYASAALWQAATSGAATNTDGSDPAVVDESASNFRLTASSPARDAGADVSLTRDYAGARVPQGSAPDIGAFEYSTYPGFVHGLARNCILDAVQSAIL